MTSGNIFKCVGGIKEEESIVYGNISQLNYEKSNYGVPGAWDVEDIQGLILWSQIKTDLICLN